MVKKWLKAILISVLGIGVITTGIYTFMTSNVEYIKKIRTDMNLQQLSETVFSGHKDYAFETCYVGDPVLPVALFKTPFRKTDSYRSNKYLLNDFTPEQFSLLAARANKDLSSIFDIAYKDIEKINKLPEVFWEGYSLANKSGEIRTYNSEETLSLIYKLYMDDHTSLETTVLTDKSLIYYDNDCFIVRAMLYITPYECDHPEQLASVLGLDDIELGKKYSKMIEVSYVTMNDGVDFNDYHIAGFEILK